MERIELVQEAGPDKTIRLSLPVEEANRRYHIVVVIEPEKAEPNPSPEDRGWPPGYFEQTFGSITDETFERQPQGDFPKPVVFD